MNHQRICIILFVFVALICQIYISAAPTNVPHFEPGPAGLHGVTNINDLPKTSQPITELPTTTPKSDASNVMILPTALFAAFVIHMF